MSNEKKTYTPNGTKIRKLRKKKSWSQQILAKKAGVEKKTIYNIEKNKEAYSTTLDLIAEALEIEASEITLDNFDSATEIQKHIISFDMLIEDRTKSFVGREFVFDAIDDFVKNNNSGYFFIRGDPGIGKSAIIAKFIMKYCLTVYHFNIAMQAVNTPRHFFKNVCARLVRQFKLPYTELPEDFERDGIFFSKLLTESAAELEENDRLVIAIDALDEVRYSNNSTTTNPLYLPFSLPDGVYIVMTARRQHELAFQGSHVYEWVLESDSDENEKDVRAFIERYLLHKGIKTWMRNRKINDGKFVDLMWDKSEGNFMYLRYVLPAIEQGQFSTGTIDELPHGLLAYYRCHWAQMRQHDVERFEQFYQPVVCVLAAVQEAVSVEQVAEWTRLKSIQVCNVLREWSEFMHTESGPNGGKLYRIYHTSFRDFLQEEVAPSLKTYHGIIANATLTKIREHKKRIGK